MKSVILSILMATLILSLAACAPGPNQMQGVENEENGVAGFWQGLWHGFISPVTFVISLFNENVSIYEIHNNGGWYDFGFLFGATIILGGSGGGAGSRRRKN